MSRWLHRELRVVVHPEQVALLQMRRTLSWRGLRSTIHDAYSVPCDSASGAHPWRAALLELETALPGYADGKTAATVILSNHFLRYALVPWRAELADAEEELAFTRHCFTKVYGKTTQQWELRLSQEAHASPRLASAVDAELLDALKGVFDGAGIVLQSIQPHLMAAFNGFRGRLRKRSAWFALLEPGNLCLALLHRGCWLRVRSLRIGSDWRAELPLILEREAYLADNLAMPHEVYLWDAESGGSALPEIEAWKFHALSPGLELGVASAPGRFSLAMAG